MGRKVSRDPDTVTDREVRRLIIPSNDVALANRVLARLRAFETHCAGSVVPPGYDSYCRILHPAESDDGKLVTWDTIAAWAGRIYHPAMQFEAIATQRPNFGSPPAPWDGQIPWNLPIEHATTLANLLKPFTPHPDQMLYLVWEGYGQSARLLAERPERRYVVYQGDLGDLMPFYDWNWGRPADYWFPQDRAWCVASDVDLYWTYVGGTQRCIEAILRCPDLEAVPADLDQGLTVDSDLVNRLSPEEKSRWS